MCFGDCYGELFTVRDLIAYASNIAGSVHAGAPHSDRERILQSLEWSVSVMGLPPTVSSLLAIGRVTQKALRPLAAVVERELDPGPP